MRVNYSTEIMDRICMRLGRIYGPQAATCTLRLEQLLGRYGVGLKGEHPSYHWDERDAFLITYGDMIRTAGEPPLRTLNTFLQSRAQDLFNTVHILPFYPYSSDDGFSVVDFHRVDPDLGDWSDVQEISQSFRLMFDLVLNHVSRKSGWFKKFVTGVAPHRNYFIEMPQNTDLSAVTRPRNTPLLTRTQTRHGERNVWATFSHDQIDLNYKNLDVLFEMLDIIYYYISKGARILRLDAIAFLWKEVGTTCLHLPEAHEIVKLFRDLLSMATPDVQLITETNVPHKENISYFGEGDEAQMVYQFSLPPLLLHALLTGNASYLTDWATSLGDLPPGCTYFNFTASHDGVGVRPLQGLLPEPEFNALLDAVKMRGGHISMKQNSDGSESPYELNITYFDALGDPEEADPGDLHIERFLCSQTIPLALRGIPAVYINSLIGARNNTEGVAQTGRARTINRGKWDAAPLNTTLDNPHHWMSRVYQEYGRRLRIRRAHPSFHPDGAQHIFDLGSELFALLRQAPTCDEAILCIHNLTHSPITLQLSEQIPHLCLNEQRQDLLSKQTINDTLQLAPYQCVWIPV